MRIDSKTPLTEDMRRVIAEQKLAFVATVCPDGKELWSRAYSNPRAHWPESVHYLQGLIWLRTATEKFEGVDPRSGERRREFAFQGSLSGGCVRDIATERYLIGTRPLDLIDLQDGTPHEFRGGRHACHRLDAFT